MAWAWQIQYCDPLLLFSWEQIYCQNPYIQRTRRQKREITWSPSPPLRFHPCNKYFNRTKLHSLSLPIYRSRYTSECLRKWFQNLLQIVPSEMCSVFVSISCNTTNLCNITYSNFCQTNSQWFDRERKRQRTREWRRERERGEGVNWLFMTPIK